VAKVLSGRKSDQLVLNQYRLVDQLISGPMAGAYVAIDPLDRRVAIEVLSAKSAADKAVLTEFQQAALKATKLQHPNVGRILDTGEAHGFYYLVKEYYEGQTIEDILERRGKLPYEHATRFMALALAGLEALHAHGVPAGDLTADCLLLAPVSADQPNQRTVKILHAGVKRKLFDETAIGRSISLVSGIPDELELVTSSTFQVTPAAAVNPAEDIFRLGCVFYRCVTGQAPFPGQEPAQPSHPAKPVRSIAPEVPEMLAEIIEQMIDPVPANRQQKAAHVAKSLRVFLAAEEHAREVKAEENLVAPGARAAARAAEAGPAADEEMDEEGDEDEEEAASARPGGAAAHEGIWGKVVALWEELDIQVRDLVFLAGGSLATLTLIFLFAFVSGIRVTYVAGLATGAVASYFVDRYVRWRQEKKAAEA
jgi:hypothetical protein